MLLPADAPTSPSTRIRQQYLRVEGEVGASA
jgi:hypothetical protein